MQLPWNLIASGLLILAVQVLISLVIRWTLDGIDLAKLRILERDLTDLHDRVEHWVRRDRVRRLRESHEPPDAQLPLAATPREVKEALRKRVYGSMSNVAKTPG